MANVLRIRNLSVEINDGDTKKTAVDHVSLRIPEGKTLALVGEAGAGKSLIAQSIMGLLPKIAQIISGEILFFDPESDGHFADLVRLPNNSPDFRAIRGGRISMVSHESMMALSPAHTIGKQIQESLIFHARNGDRMATVLGLVEKIDRQTVQAVTLDVLDLVGFKDSRAAAKAYPFEFNPELRQRALLAMALICRPALVIADGLTTDLDLTGQSEILRLLRDLQAQLQTSILLITHDLNVVRNVADEVIIIKDGQLVEQGLVTDIFNDARHPHLKSLLEPLPRVDPDRAPHFKSTPLSTTIQSLFKNRKESSDATRAVGLMYQIRGLHKTYNRHRKPRHRRAVNYTENKALKGVSLDIKVGSCIGIVGGSHAGKSTLAHTLLKTVDPDAGEILFNNRGSLSAITQLNRRKLMAYRTQVQMIFQDPFSSLNPHQTIYNALLEPLDIHSVGAPAERTERICNLLNLVGLDDSILPYFPNAFSGDQRQRIILARALTLLPDVLICDEIGCSLNVSVQVQILDIIKSLQTPLNLTIVFISRNFAVINQIADYVAVMCKGHIVEQAPRDALFRNPSHPYTQALLAATPTLNPGQIGLQQAPIDSDPSDPASWDKPFALMDGDVGHWRTIAEGHNVLIESPPL